MCFLEYEYHFIEYEYYDSEDFGGARLDTH